MIDRSDLRRLYFEALQIKDRLLSVKLDDLVDLPERVISFSLSGPQRNILLSALLLPGIGFVLGNPSEAGAYLIDKRGNVFYDGNYQTEPGEEHSRLSAQIEQSFKSPGLSIADKAILAGDLRRAGYKLGESMEEFPCSRCEKPLVLYYAFGPACIDALYSRTLNANGCGKMPVGNHRIQIK